ncbi:2Fe-2S ferredoxin [Zhongshania marina]|uniref:2Fe-2S ferredoxin n=2 Tax=Zhongshania marina TaxID=2304603 RepID=A0ABX9W4M1_9GAMM|nr:2Fe-2S ferredoxin [Zhongshania marina]
MLKMTFITPSGEEITTEGNVGGSVMEAAVSANVAGIDAECGGACSCATCHVKLSAEWFAVVGEAGELEASMLEYANDADDYSRLSCQMKIAENYNGIIIKVVG